MSARTIPTFAEVAALIGPNHCENWLPAFLEWWAQGVRHDRFYDDTRSTTERTRERLTEFAAAATLIKRGLDDPVIRSLLGEANHNSQIRTSTWQIQDLASRADHAFSSTYLDAGDGTAKRGRGKPKIPGIFDARTLLAARIFEMWRLFRKHQPGVGSRSAAAAAHAYWLAIGGQWNGHGDPLNGWKQYFKIVRDQTGDPGLKQLIWSIDLEQARRRGGPPWYLGTYYPPPAAEIKSTIPTK